MTKLSLIDAEARRPLGRIRPERIERIGAALRELCAVRWLELRGPAPLTPLTQALWDAQPPPADLYVELFAAGDPRLAAALGRLTPAQGLAVLALDDLAHDRAEGARAAHEAMMAFRSPGSRSAFCADIGGRVVVRKPRKPHWHRHSSRPAFEKAMVAIRDETGRDDADGLAAAIDFLARVQSGAAAAGDDAGAEQLLQALRDLGIVFLGFERRGLRYALHGVERKRVALRDLR
ncbi:MAG: hypothetical protein EPO27_17865 [Betaproteobacteria bacterium]|nr:MAG: hypothetical protein EPO27_17865 [Betaproteobacteria bacterium]